MNAWLRIGALGLALVLTAPERLTAQTLPSGNVILKHFEETFAGVRDFTATLTADVDMERVRIPKMTATVYFKRPDKVRYVSPNFAMMPKEGIALDPAMIRERFTAAVTGVDTIELRPCYRLALTAKDPKARTRTMTLWVDEGQWTAAKLETAPYQGRKVTARFTYARSGDAQWLPAEVVVEFAVGEDLDLSAAGAVPGREDAARNQPRTGMMTIRYSEYRVNTGLPDSLFQSEMPR